MTANDANPEKGQEGTEREAIFTERDGLEASGLHNHADDRGHVVVDGEEQPETADMIADLHLHNTDGSGHVAVRAEWSADEPPVVRVTHLHPNLTLHSELSPERARRLSAELRLAATHAEQGAGEAGWSDE